QHPRAKQNDAGSAHPADAADHDPGPGTGPPFAVAVSGESASQSDKECGCQEKEREEDRNSGEGVPICISRLGGKGTKLRHCKPQQPSPDQPAQQDRKQFKRPPSTQQGATECRCRNEPRSNVHILRPERHCKEARESEYCEIVKAVSGLSIPFPGDC